MLLPILMTSLSRVNLHFKRGFQLKIVIREGAFKHAREQAMGNQSRENASVFRGARN